LKKGYKVRIDMLIRGREKAHPEVAKEKLDYFLSLIEEPYKMEQNPKRGPRGLTMIISRS